MKFTSKKVSELARRLTSDDKIALLSGQPVTVIEETENPNRWRAPKPRPLPPAYFIPMVDWLEQSEDFHARLARTLEYAKKHEQATKDAEPVKLERLFTKAEIDALRKKRGKPQGQPPPRHDDEWTHEPPDPAYWNSGAWYKGYKQDYSYARSNPGWNTYTTPDSSGVGRQDAQQYKRPYGSGIYEEAKPPEPHKQYEGIYEAFTTYNSRNERISSDNYPPNPGESAYNHNVRVWLMFINMKKAGEITDEQCQKLCVAFESQYPNPQPKAKPPAPEPEPEMTPDELAEKVREAIRRAMKEKLENIMREQEQGVLWGIDENGKPNKPPEPPEPRGESAYDTWLRKALKQDKPSSFSTARETPGEAISESLLAELLKMLRKK